METINSHWIRGPITKHQLLTIKSFQAHGHPFVLWAYEKPDVPCEVRDARELLPESEIFLYKNMWPDWAYSRGIPQEQFVLGGIAERLNAAILYEVGGWAVNMDVTCLRPFEFDADYVFRPHHRGLVTNIVKAPRHAEVSLHYLNHQREKIDENNRDWEYSFFGLYEGVMKYGLEKYIVSDETFWRDDWELWQFKHSPIGPGNATYAIHWCAVIGCDDYFKGSFYDQLLVKYGLE